MNIIKNSIRKYLLLFVLLILSLGLLACGNSQKETGNLSVSAQVVAGKNTTPSAGKESKKQEEADKTNAADVSVTEEGIYTSKEEVAAYIHMFGHLPDNYITKREAEDLGWENREGNLWEVAPGKSIGGSRFGNYEGNLPEAANRKYFECDIDFEGGYRGAKRIIYSNDGLIFYTEDHYKTFEQLY